MEISDTSDASFSVVSYEKLSFAGDPIQLKFEGTNADNTTLVIENSWGTTALQPTFENNLLTFNFPKHINKKSGLCHWSLVKNQIIAAEGELTISPNPNYETHIESYLGPRSITAIDTDFSMHVIVPTDIYDNPLSEGTKITSTYQFQKDIKTDLITLKNLIGWNNIYAPKTSGRILVTSSCNDSNSKELTSIVYPGNAVDFTINYKRNHDYADGNQIIVFSSDIIKDTYDNIVSDGTLATFLITNAKGVQLSASGTTLNGIAKARFLHPFEKDYWQVKAYITGAAQSKSINVSFVAAIKDYTVTLSANNSIITIENIESFMEQIVPDGIPITIKLYDKKGTFITKFRETSRLGKATFELSTDFYNADEYIMETTVAGISKKQNITLQ